MEPIELWRALWGFFESKEQGIIALATFGLLMSMLRLPDPEPPKPEYKPRYFVKKDEK